MNLYDDSNTKYERNDNNGDKNKTNRTNIKNDYYNKEVIKQFYYLLT